MGVRVRKNESGWLRSAEVKRCIRDVMHGEKKDEYKRNATKWMQKAKKAMRERRNLRQALIPGMYV